MLKISVLGALEVQNFVDGLTRQTDNPTYRSSQPELKKCSFLLSDFAMHFQEKKPFCLNGRVHFNKTDITAYNEP